MRLLSAIGDRDGYRHEDFDVSPAHGHFGSEHKRKMGTCRELDIAWQEPNILVRIGGRLQYSFDGGMVHRPRNQSAGSVSHPTAVAFSMASAKPRPAEARASHPSRK